MGFRKKHLLVETAEVGAREDNRPDEDHNLQSRERSNKKIPRQLPALESKSNRNNRRVNLKIKRHPSNSRSVPSIRRVIFVGNQNPMPIR